VLVGFVESRRMGMGSKGIYKQKEEEEGHSHNRKRAKFFYSN
jgi:hypothetical protein